MTKMANNDTKCHKRRLEMTKMIETDSKHLKYSQKDRKYSKMTKSDKLSL